MRLRYTTSFYCHQRVSLKRKYQFYLLIPLSGAEGTRTPDLLRAKEALSQLSYSPSVKSYYSNKGLYSQFSPLASLSVMLVLRLTGRRGIMANH